MGSITPAKDGLNVGLLLSRRLDDRRILRTEKLTSSPFSHRVIVREAAEIDDQLLGWLADAYDFKGRRESD